ncbi:hypothetical protein HK405_003186 [Cladochytrium tenue]|nr:hypothetical protein HK405_003186 [Cladochytrium tenue]
MAVPSAAAAAAAAPRPPAIVTARSLSPPQQPQQQLAQRSPPSRGGIPVSPASAAPAMTPSLLSSLPSAAPAPSTAPSRLAPSSVPFGFRTVAAASPFRLTPGSPPRSFAFAPPASPLPTPGFRPSLLLSQQQPFIAAVSDPTRRRSTAAVLSVPFVADLDIPMARRPPPALALPATPLPPDLPNTATAPVPPPEVSPALEKDAAPTKLQEASTSQATPLPVTTVDRATSIAGLHHDARELPPRWATAATSTRTLLHNDAPPSGSAPSPPATQQQQSTREETSRLLGLLEQRDALLVDLQARLDAASTLSANLAAENARLLARPAPDPVKAKSVAKIRETNRLLRKEVEALHTHLAESRTQSAYHAAQADTLRQLAGAQSESLRVLSEASAALETRLEAAATKPPSIVAKPADHVATPPQAADERPAPAERASPDLDADTPVKSSAAPRTEGDCTEYRGSIDAGPDAAVPENRGAAPAALAALLRDLIALRHDQATNCIGSMARPVETVEPVDAAPAKRATAALAAAMVEESDKELRLCRAHLEETLALAERFRAERDRALDTAQRVLRDCARKEAHLRSALAAKEADLIRVLEKDLEAKLITARQQREARTFSTLRSLGVIVGPDWPAQTVAAVDHQP